MRFLVRAIRDHLSPTTRPEHHRETEEASAPLNVSQYFEKN